MMPAESHSLVQECAVFSRYLVGVGADSYVARKYAEAHDIAPDYSAANRFDGLLVKLAARGPRLSAVADAYASLFARRSALRRKLILLVAILESCAPERGFTDAADAASPPLVYARMVAGGLAFVMRLAAATVIFLPLQAALGGFVRHGE